MSKNFDSNAGCKNFILKRGIVGIKNVEELKVFIALFGEELIFHVMDAWRENGKFWNRLNRILVETQFLFA